MRDGLQVTDLQARLAFTGMLLGLSTGQLLVGTLSDALGGGDR
ncbi:hypothetical protein GCM10009555_056430 [Acrocarpospora macrocephala]|uniref:Major facilitator superfamily (MFS) profile domain-containing protein n=1 Tax=Acrocarpospora macrocephala TaxID=150177 RepID=A0A5M3WMR5_9ACTN|nr:hypothetical protein [Acrocarpospora macrocephala]GES08471.1 hypothetical protein Amac_020670 [Acrocarpospora macrocephala]